MYLIFAAVGLLAIYKSMALKSGSLIPAGSPSGTTITRVPVSSLKTFGTTITSQVAIAPSAIKQPTPSGISVNPSVKQPAAPPVSALDAATNVKLKVDSHLQSIHTLAYTDSLFLSSTEGLGPDDFEKERATLGFTEA